MNITEYIYIMNKPEAVQEKQTAVLEKIVQEFPYFQSARALYLKGLYNQNSFKYNYVLKVTAAHTADRSVLFDFITSDTFAAIHKDLLEQKLSEISDITVAESEIVEPKLEVRENSVEQSILSSIKEAGQDIAQEAIEIPVEDNWFPVTEIDTENVEPEAIPAETEVAEEVASAETEPIEAEAVSNETELNAKPINAEPQTDIPAEVIFERLPEEEPTIEAAPETEALAEKLDIGKPLEFSAGERHSFHQWLQLSKFKPIDRQTGPEPEISPENSEAGDDFSESDLEKQKKNELIDRFIETSPKIPPVKTDAPVTPSMIVEPSMADNTFLMTETLARVYLEQKKYRKAIQAYEILILKYPEKSSFFADRILDIKNLQQNNT